MKNKEYTIETADQTPLDSCFNKHLAILKCIFCRKAKYVFEFVLDENYAPELTGCVFRKERKNG